MTGATARGLLVAVAIATPALLLPNIPADSNQITVLVALLAGFLTFTEYNSSSPSIVEFRDAPPFNRMRFCSLMLTILFLSLVLRHAIEPSAATGALSGLGIMIGNLLDFPYSPVRLAVLMLPADVDPRLAALVRSCAGIAYAISLVTMALFAFMVRFGGWPTRRGPFNVWVNLPLFDPTAGGDVLEHLQRDARVNLAIGFLLPFLIPAVVKATYALLNPISLQNPQTIIWSLSAWAFIPASMIMRGLAMRRVASMIADKRRRKYASAHQDGGLQTA